MARMGWTLTFLTIFAGFADAGIFSKKKPQAEEVPGGHPRQLVTTNGVVVPAWASRRIQESPVPLYGKSWGRRPWALPLSQQATASAVMARADQLGFGAGPIPGYTNGPTGSGNYPVASVGPGEVNGWAPRYGLRSLFLPTSYPKLTTSYPYNTAITGF